jgi:hypothetical protein
MLDSLQVRIRTLLTEFYLHILNLNPFLVCPMSLGKISVLLSNTLLLIVLIYLQCLNCYFSVGLVSPSPKMNQEQFLPQPVVLHLLPCLSPYLLVQAVHQHQKMSLSHLNLKANSEVLSLTSAAKDRKRIWILKINV